jgi:hypothetical protein
MLLAKPKLLPQPLPQRRAPGASTLLNTASLRACVSYVLESALTLRRWWLFFFPLLFFFDLGRGVAHQAEHARPDLKGKRKPFTMLCCCCLLTCYHALLATGMLYLLLTCWDLSKGKRMPFTTQLVILRHDILSKVLSNTSSPEPVVI